MPSCEVHEEECKRKLGRPYRNVHEWLDEFAPQYHGSKRHREIRHNEEGVNYIYNRWGQRAAQAAIIHIQRDNQENVPDIVRNMSLFRRRR